MNRQESLLSASRRQTPPPPEKRRRREKPIGCMSGIFQLLSKYQNKTKRLTFGRKREKYCEETSPAAPEKVIVMNDDHNKEVRIQRSPGLSPEIRRENAKGRPALVQRLMGLEENQSPAPECELSLTEVKRKMLLQALEKCNQDLEALKKIIQSVESSTSPASPRLPPACSKRCTEHQVLSPISVLDEQMISRSPNLTRSQDTEALCTAQATHNVAIDGSINSILKKLKTSHFRTKREEVIVSSPVKWRSKAVVKSVEEVCRDIACGEHGEARKIGVLLQDYICKELIQELVKELGYSKYSPWKHSLPFEACRRRLCL
ncbi:unnamed protein product [Cuscuta europaea]|uniref:Uncharacterized protein n=1 Tax=Cuscuta europaea TaxID=41803 RepID=A0A9P1EEB9_CUSEU|nr:unnamed protein product [Cuscuta europaea]